MTGRDRVRMGNKELTACYTTDVNTWVAEVQMSLCCCLCYIGGVHPYCASAFGGLGHSTYRSSSLLMTKVKPIAPCKVMYIPTGKQQEKETEEHHAQALRGPLLVLLVS